MQSTMMDFPLTIQHIFRHGRKVFGNSEVVTWTGAEPRRASFTKVADRAERLAAALRRLGVGEGDRVGTLQWNNQEHLEAYLAVPCMGAVLHTLNLRLFSDQLAFIVNHGEDKVVIVDESLIPVLARVKDQLKTVEHIIVAGSGDASALGDGVLRYEELIAAESSGFAWPELDERAAAAMCYTTGTTGDPKGVVYSHRSIFLHTFGVGQGAAIPLTESDRILAIVPMFHALSWGLPYLGWSCGADFVMPGPFLQAEPLARMIASERVTFSSAVPAILNDLLRFAEQNETDLSSLRMVMGERPLACIVLKEGSERDAEALRGFLCGKVSPWWLPERWTFVPEIPRTSVGKFDKKVLRARYAEGELEVVELEGAKRSPGSAGVPPAD